MEGSLNSVLMVVLLSMVANATGVVEDWTKYKMKVYNYWRGGMHGGLCFKSTVPLECGFKAILVFHPVIDILNMWDVKQVTARHFSGGSAYVIESKEYIKKLEMGKQLCLGFVALTRYHGFLLYNQIKFKLQANSCESEQTTTTKPAGSPFDFRKVLELSILFYEAQRSGNLSDNRIPWRGDSATDDGSDVNMDLSGGWYDGGDFMKFTLPMAASVTRLAWSLIMWRDAYESAGELENMFDCIKWPLDYFLKCWNPDTKVFYVQVGDVPHDHEEWTRPEDMTTDRPSYNVSVAHPGSDVAANAAAAMAAGAIAFKEKDPEYAEELLVAAESLYEFASNNLGKYSDSIPQAAQVYGSSGYIDDLALGSVWLYKATNKEKYISNADISDFQIRPWALDWDDKSVSAALLIYEEIGEESFRKVVEDFIEDFMPDGTMEYTPCGLAFRLKWGSLRYSANVAMLALFAAESFGGEQAEIYRSWAYGQISYMLGNNKYGMSYLIGYGDSYPLKPYHKGASCDDPPEKCDWANFNSPDPNPQELIGALVGGPDNQDDFVDSRKDLAKNAVSVEYNAGFQAAVAGLLYLELNDNLPSPSLEGCKE